MKYSNEYLKRNRWLTRTRGIALTRLKKQFPKEYMHILNQVRREYPEVIDEETPTS